MSELWLTHNLKKQPTEDCRVFVELNTLVLARRLILLTPEGVTNQSCCGDRSRESERRELWLDAEGERNSADDHSPTVEANESWAGR